MGLWGRGLLDGGDSDLGFSLTGCENLLRAHFGKALMVSLVVVFLIFRLCCFDSFFKFLFWRGGKSILLILSYAICKLETLIESVLFSFSIGGMK